VNNAIAIEPSAIFRVEKSNMLRALRDRPEIAREFITALLVRNIHLEEDLCDQLFNHSERRLARVLLKLSQMHERHPHSVQVLRQLQRLHQQRGDWSSVIRLLPELRKDKVLPASELAELERRAWGENLTLAARQEEGGAVGLQSLNRAWQQLTAAQRQEPQLVLAYAEQLRQLGAEVEAEEVLRAALKRQYDSHLARLYGLLRGSDPARQLQTAEGWLKQHPDDPSLLLTLGRLCLQTSLWGKARDYLESSLRLQRNPEACAELARLLAQLGDTDRSNQLFQEGLGLLDERLLASPLPVPVRA
jgi:HemY protein